MTVAYSITYYEGTRCTDRTINYRVSIGKDGQIVAARSHYDGKWGERTNTTQSLSSTAAFKVIHDSLGYAKQ